MAYDLVPVHAHEGLSCRLTSPFVTGQDAAIVSQMKLTGKSTAQVHAEIVTDCFAKSASPAILRSMISSDEQLAARRILPVTEEELQRIILNIHDGPVQKLFAALSQLNLMQTRVARGDASKDEWPAWLARVSGLVEASLAEIKTSLGTFRPPEFARRDLLSVLEGLIIQHEEFTGSQVDIEVRGEIPPVSLPVKIALYRILQEALSNAYRHADVEQARVILSTTGGHVRLEVIDRGRGFTPPPLTGPQATERAEHIGLRGMRERVSLVDGTFAVESAPGAGTRIIVEVPCGE
jgi:signal transduction histidine kinase